jgi:hypothetical protein
MWQELTLPAREALLESKLHMQPIGNQLTNLIFFSMLQGTHPSVTAFIGLQS